MTNKTNEFKKLALLNVFMIALCSPAPGWDIL